VTNPNPLDFFASSRTTADSCTSPNSVKYSVRSESFVEAGKPPIKTFLEEKEF
jgi:hypothetical protein